MKKLVSALLASSVLSSLVACGAPMMPMPMGMNPAFNNPMLSAASMNRIGIQSTAVNSSNPRKAGQTMRIATYNIRNLFDGIPNPPAQLSSASFSRAQMQEPRVDDDQQFLGTFAAKAPWVEKPKPEKELQALSQSIHDINADVIGFQEVESKEILTRFRDNYLSDMGYKHIVLIEGNDPRGIDVALMSRYPVTDVKNYMHLRFPIPGRPEPEGFSRDFLQVRIQAPNNYNFTMFVAHLKSQHGGDEADVKREAEAKQMNQIIRDFQQANPRENFVIVGDFNDVPTAQHIAPMVNPQVSGLGLSDVILEEMGQQPWVFTYHPQKYRSRIDYILLSPGMKNEYIRKSAFLYKPRKEGETWQKLYFYDASDHIPATIDLDISQDR